MSAGPRAPTPFTVIGGFLGAGKTTLLNRVLANAEGLRCAVLVNDFGAIAVDASLIAAHDGETMTLANGCACCSLAGGFIETMLRVTAERHRFDHVLVEASGVAEPERLMDIARLDPELAPGAIVVVVDAEALPARLADRATGDLVATQLRAAELLVVNKIDLVSATALGEVLDTVRAHAPGAALVRSVQSDVPLAVVLGAGTVSGTTGATDATGTTGTTGAMVDTIGERGAGGTVADPGEVLDASDDARAAPRTVAADRFHTTSLSGTEPLARAALERLDASLGAEVVRAKGIVRLRGERGWWSWQRVGARSRVEPLALDEDAGRPDFAAVLIATGPIRHARLELPAGVENGTPERR